MKTRADDEKRRWAAALAGGVLLAGVGALLFRLPAAPAARTTDLAPAAVVLQRVGPTNEALSDEALMRDWTPLFLPTEYNATLKRLPHREPGQTFLDGEGVKLIYAAEPKITRDLPSMAALNSKPPEKAGPADVMLEDEAGSTPSGFGRGPVEVRPIDPRGGFVEVLATATGQRVLAETLGAEVRPPGDKPWQPVEFLAAIDAAGLVAPLIVADGSRVEEVDAYFRNFLARTFRIGERLPPGVYRVIVGP